MTPPSEMAAVGRPPRPPPTEGAADEAQDLADPERPLQQEEARLRAQERTLYLVASLVRRGFNPDLSRGEAGAAPQVHYLDRYVQLVRLLTHGQQLFDELLPRIRNRLSFVPERYTEARPFQARGPIDWAATLRGAWSRAETNPTVLVSRRPTRDYATPENQLTALTLIAVHRDAARLLRELGHRLDPSEEAQLRRLVALAERTRRIPQLATLMDQLPGEFLIDPEGPEATRLEQATSQRARYRLRTMAPYLDLVDWRETWRSWLTDANQALRRTPIWDVDDNHLYEFVVLFELAQAFAARSRRTVQRRGRRDGSRPLFTFWLDDGRELELWYQTSGGLKPYTAVGGTPDVVLRVGSLTILGDMKNYAPSHYTEGVYKMLGYLYNFGYPDRWNQVDGGVLFFPEPRHNHLSFQVLPPRLASPANGQQLASLIVPPSGVTGQSAEWINKFAAWVLELPETGPRTTGR